ncbi:hypothetical protein [Arcobacter defluvii]|jgi:hypothetical protein|uniref:Uncharacterized protein n=1 Tax=Arcobacter defluvii TaxID=873191 RepID=A0AAE7BFQ0_9BACT|nr:hypothetical protein [Arcobacter defluvii]QKF78238.1 hypothetical protein ADFLV_2230 [Arcobacter defluvii]RXI33342.1 hypothetical protein CP964_07155 [Arcobacter defluvii]
MKDNKIQNWLENAFNARDNEETIFIRDLSIYYVNKPLYSKIDFIKLNYKDTDYSVKFKNSIIPITNNIDAFPNLIKKSIKDGFIFIEDEDSIKKLIFAIETKNITICNEIKYSLVKPINLEKILKYSRENLRKFIDDRENILKSINDKYIKFNKEDLEYFLEVYYKRNILIAAFIQKLYRLVNVNFLVSEKKIGEILSNILNISSKTVTLKYIGVIGGTKKNGNIRVYDLNFNQTELNIKIKIATNLLKLNLKELDIKKISKNTDLSINQIEKIYKKIFIK